VFVNNGADGTYGNGGLGGTFSTDTNATNTWDTIAGSDTTITDHLQMSGLSGGGYGLSGTGDTYAKQHAGGNVGSSWGTVSGDYGLRQPGDAGYIVYGSTQVLTGGNTGDGTYEGNITNITVS
jgi:hypothetical protein